jgi:hypothetical protein
MTVLGNIVAVTSIIAVVSLIRLNASVGRRFSIKRAPTPSTSSSFRSPQRRIREGPPIAHHLATRGRFHRYGGETIPR